MTEIADLTATEMLRRFRTQELSPVEAAEACLGRIEALDRHVNAFCYLDRERTLAQARASEARWKAGAPLGLVDGVPTAIKDVFLTVGQPNRKGSKVISDAPATVNAPAVAALERHGLVNVGRTTSPDFAWKGVTDSPLTGVTTNPYDPTKTAGGSSGGSAAAVPLGMAPLATGTDAGGSIRIPAGFCGIVGHKPTLGLCPMWPPSAFAPLAHVGPMTATVEDAALLMNVLAERDPRDVTLPPNRVDFLGALEGDLQGVRIAFSPTLGYVEVDPEIAALVAAAARSFEDLGAVVEEVDPGFANPREAFDVLFYGGAANAMRDLGAKERSQMDPGLVAVAEWAEKLTLLDLLGAHNVRASLIETMSLFHERYDLLLTPTLPIPAFEGGLEVPAGSSDPRWPSWTPFTWPFNLTGQPALSVPCGFTAAGLPAGLQIVGPAHGDAAVLRAGHLYQTAHPTRERRPSILETAR